MTSRTRDRFDGQIAGLGTSAGPSVVIGAWHHSPFGSFVDAMVQTREGRRLLLAPDDRVAAYVAQTYTFDEVRVVPVELERSDQVWRLDAGGLELRLELGRRPPLGRLLRLVPRRLARSTRWAGVLDPFVRLVLPGVRTRGTAGHGRREWYGATDVRLIEAASGRWQGRDVGRLTDVDPPVRFGFGSTPRTPMITDVTSTVQTSSS